MANSKSKKKKRKKGKLREEPSERHEIARNARRRAAISAAGRDSREEDPAEGIDEENPEAPDPADAMPALHESPRAAWQRRRDDEKKEL